MFNIILFLWLFIGFTSYLFYLKKFEKFSFINLAYSPFFAILYGFFCYKILSPKKEKIVDNICNIKYDSYVEDTIICSSIVSGVTIINVD